MERNIKYNDITVFHGILPPFEEELSPGSEKNRTIEEQQKQVIDTHENFLNVYKSIYSKQGYKDFLESFIRQTWLDIQYLFKASDPQTKGPTFPFTVRDAYFILPLYESELGKVTVEILEEDKNIQLTQPQVILLLDELGIIDYLKQKYNGNKSKIAKAIAGITGMNSQNARDHIIYLELDWASMKNRPLKVIKKPDTPENKIIVQKYLEINKL